MRVLFGAVIVCLIWTVYFGTPIDKDADAGRRQVVTGLSNKSCLNSGDPSLPMLPKFNGQTMASASGSRPNKGHCYYNRFVDVDYGAVDNPYNPAAPNAPGKNYNDTGGFDNPATFQKKKKKKIYKSVRKAFQKNPCVVEEWPGGPPAEANGAPYCISEANGTTYGSPVEDRCPDKCREPSESSSRGCVYMEGCEDDDTPAGMVSVNANTVERAPIVDVKGTTYTDDYYTLEPEVVIPDTDYVDNPDDNDYINVPGVDTTAPARDTSCTPAQISAGECDLANDDNLVYTNEQIAEFDGMTQAEIDAYVDCNDSESEIQIADGDIGTFGADEFEWMAWTIGNSCTVRTMPNGSCVYGTLDTRTCEGNCADDGITVPSGKCEISVGGSDERIISCPDLGWWNYTSSSSVSGWSNSYLCPTAQVGATGETIFYGTRYRSYVYTLSNPPCSTNCLTNAPTSSYCRPGLVAAVPTNNSVLVSNVPVRAQCACETAGNCNTIPIFVDPDLNCGNIGEPICL